VQPYIPHSYSEIEATFQRIWGYERFRPPQDKIVQALLTGQDALVVMATGGGKSICFQLPALLQRGLTLVISPLVALIENQVAELQAKQLPAGLLHSQLPKPLRSKTLQSLENQTLRLLYLSPETLLSPPVWTRLLSPQLQINGLILDEAHCLAQWGETFRPAYRRLGAVRPALLQHKPPGSRMAIAAFTATANPATQQVITEVLQLQQPQLFRLNPYRENLNLGVKQVWTPRGRKQHLKQWIQTHQEQAGLIYTRTRREAEELAQWLSGQNFQALAYHGGLGVTARRQREADWLDDRLQVIVCTNAFGMGINKPNVRWILHYQVPLLLAEYMQEVGRAGRDGQQADALALVSEPTGWLDDTDRKRWQFFQQQQQRQMQQAQSLLSRLPPSGSVAEVAQSFPQGEIALSLLHSLGQLDWLDPFHYQIRVTTSRRPIDLAQKIQTSADMQNYLKTQQCRWRFLVEAFGFRETAKTMKCGNCDNCRGW
jgi:ATP-dependent DNA helicase RecQ